MLSTTVGLATLIVVGIAFLVLGIARIGRRKQSVEEYTVSRNHAPTNIGIATLVASMFGTWVLMSPGETGANFGIVSLIGYALGMAGIPVMFMFVGPRLRELMPNGHSVTEYVRHRFGAVPFISIAVVIVFVMGIFIAAEMTAITTAVTILTGTPALATALGVGIVVVIYTAYGGLRASIFTDTIQFWVLMPALLLIVIVAAVLIGGSGAWGKAGATGLLSFTSSGSYYFAIVLIIGIVASNAFHPGMWQRVYTVKDQQALNRSLWTAAAISIPITFLMGLAGVAAVANGSVGPFEYPAVAAALFALGSDIFPIWMHFLMLICALMLAMSTLDTLMNGLASNVASDLADTHISTEGNALMAVARVVTVIVVIPAIFVAAQGFSVLYVFLIADLLGAAIAVPMLIGLYSRRMPGWGVLLAGGVGIVVGALYYPTPDLLSPWALTAPFGTQMFFAFASALVVSSVISAVVILVRQPAQDYDFGRLNEEVQLIEGNGELTGMDRIDGMKILRILFIPVAHKSIHFNPLGHSGRATTCSIMELSFRTASSRVLPSSVLYSGLGDDLSVPSRFR